MDLLLLPGSLTALEHRLVGRDGALGRLAGLLDERRPAAVVGAPGSGKTAVLRSAAADRGRRVFSGVCLDALSWMPLLPLSQALGTQLSEHDPIALADLIQREVGDGTLLLDNLHAADPDTIDAICRLAGAVAIAVAYSDAACPTHVSEALSAAGFEQVRLEPLSRRDAGRLAARMHPGLDEHARAALVVAAEGSPQRLIDHAVMPEPPADAETAGGDWSSDEERRDPRRRRHRDEARRLRAALAPLVGLRRGHAADDPTSPFEALLGPDAVPHAERVWLTARQQGKGEAAARVALANALFAAGDAGCITHFEAIVRSLADIDRDVTFEAAYGLLASRLAFGDPVSSRELATAMVERARLAGDPRHEAVFRLARAQLDLLHEGLPRGVVVETHRSLPAVEGTQAGFLALVGEAIAQAEMAQDRAAVATAREAIRRASSAPLAAIAAWVCGEVELSGGRPAGALVAAREAREAAPAGFAAGVLATLTEGWARHEIDEGLVLPLTGVPYPALAGAVPESEALALLAGGDAVAAADRFEQAARRWLGYSLRRSVRCRLGAGIALREAGRRPAARTVLDDALRRARAAGLTALAERIERARGGANAQPGGLAQRRLTARETEVVGLAGDGHTSIEIADMLGIERSTVDAHVRSAMAKTGASTRLQAALIARRIEGGEHVEIEPRRRRRAPLRAGQLEPSMED